MSESTPAPTTAQSERLLLAETFLQEAAYRSRETGAASAALGESAAAGCGLGAKPALALDLSRRAEELFARLWPAELAGEDLARIRAVMTDWIARQDALDRRRNHFLKEFRQRHGFDRNAYGAEQLRDFDAGLARINAEESQSRRAAARSLPTPR
jgi:hypothetical protein